MLCIGDTRCVCEREKKDGEAKAPVLVQKAGRDEVERRYLYAECEDDG